MDEFIKRLSWIVRNGLIEDVFFGENSIILPWGVETADSWAFFSLDKTVGYRYKIIEKSEKVESNYLESMHVVEMKEGKWKLETTDKLEEDKIVRTAKLTCLEDSVLMDFVLRFRFRKELFNCALINNKMIEHANKNVYHQYEVNESMLIGEDIKVKIEASSVETSDKFSAQMYVRDQLGEWVVHARMIPIQWHKVVIKLCSRYFNTSPLPQWLTNCLLKIDKIKKYLWYRNEREPYQSRWMKFFSPNAFPMVKLSKGNSISWKVVVSFNE